MAGKSPFITEAIAEYSVGISITVIRLFIRWKLAGFKKWGGDEYFSILAALLWTLEIIPVILVGNVYNSSAGWTPEERASFDEPTVRRLQIGSQLVLAGWFGYISAIWALKASMLFFYDRITSGLFEQKIVRSCAIYCIISYVAVFLALIIHCRPFHKNWQVYPDPGQQCSNHKVIYPVTLVFNILCASLTPAQLSHIVLVGVPVPILVRLQAKLVKKLMIGALLCSGVFIIVAALLRCILVLSSIDQINVAAIWAVRETFVAMVVVNAPAIKPLFHLSTWSRRFRPTVSSSDYPLSSISNARKVRPAQRNSGPCSSGPHMFAESDEAIVPQTFAVEVAGKPDASAASGIRVTTDFETRYEPA